MTTATTTTSNNTTSARTGLIGWVLNLDATYRQYRKLISAEDARLADMGLTRKQANNVFYRRFGQHRSFDS